MKSILHICLLMALWTMLVAPSTCGSGLLEHACDDNVQELCHHESDCPTDPCNLAGSVTVVIKSITKVKVALLNISVPVTLQMPLDGVTPVPAATCLVSLSSQAASLPLIC